MEQDSFDYRLQQLAADQLPEGSLCVGWVAVMEYILPNGDRSLVMMQGSDSDSMPEWQRDGYLIAALRGGFDPVDDV